MTAHKHAEMIKAKADNMELVVFYKLHGEEWWQIDDSQLPDDDEVSYFLCLPQHKEACLHWLNGGLIECNSNLTNGWEGCADYNDCFWRIGCGMMREDANYRIKPRKEKRWIVTNGVSIKFANTNEVYPEEWQIIEIEVEV